MGCLAQLTAIECQLGQYVSSSGHRHRAYCYADQRRKLHGYCLIDDLQCPVVTLQLHVQLGARPHVSRCRYNRRFNCPHRQLTMNLSKRRLMYLQERALMKLDVDKVYSKSGAWVI